MLSYNSCLILLPLLNRIAELSKLVLEPDSTCLAEVLDIRTAISFKAKKKYVENN